MVSCGTLQQCKVVLTDLDSTCRAPFEQPWKHHLPKFVIAFRSVIMNIQNGSFCCELFEAW